MNPEDQPRCAECGHRKSSHRNDGDLEWCNECPSSQEGCLEFVPAPSPEEPEEAGDEEPTTVMIGVENGRLYNKALTRTQEIQMLRDIIASAQEHLAEIDPHWEPAEPPSPEEDQRPDYSCAFCASKDRREYHFAGCTRYEPTGAGQAEETPGLSEARAELFRALMDMRVSDGGFRLQQAAELRHHKAVDAFQAAIADEARRPLLDALEQAESALRENITTWITLEPALGTPYPDDQRWTPWTRFGERAFRAAGRAQDAVRRALASGGDEAEGDSDAS